MVTTRKHLRLHGMLSMTSDMHMCIFNKETSVMVAFVLHVLTRLIFYFQQRVK